MTQKTFIVSTTPKRALPPSWLTVIDLVTRTLDANAVKVITYGSDRSCVPIDQVMACAVTERCSCAPLMGYWQDKFALARRSGEAT